MKILPKINTISDLKRLERNHLPRLCGELRSFLLGTISQTGGHLASNLGVVELTVALHYVFNSPRDKLVWDVGHQAYVHKILTGRKGKFAKLRQFEGLSGFPKACESPHDHFDTGHSSTGISAAVGYAKARDLNKDTYNVIAVVGDGSLTGGLAFEGLNNGGRMASNLIIILNDNQWSISENVGAVSKMLSLMRSDPNYRHLKSDLKEFIRGTPLVGEALAKVAEKTKDTIRSVFVPGQLFEELGFTYIGPINGHNLEDLIDVFNNVKGSSRPILIHLQTMKGKGYPIAEANPGKFHGVEPFNLATGTPLIPKMPSYSGAFGNALLGMARQNKDIVAITAAMCDSTGLASFAAEMPERFFDVGIAEAHGATFAAGLAKAGKRPVFAVYSTFLQRAYDQVIHDICIPNANVIFAIDRAGIVGGDGETHQGLFDTAFLSPLPNMRILAPRDCNELGAMLAFALTLDGPVAIRYPRANAQHLDAPQASLELGRAEWVLRPKQNNEPVDTRTRITIISVGTMYHTAQAVCERLALNPLIAVSHVCARFIKPMDTQMLREAAGESSFIYTIEDGVQAGGYGTILAAYAANNNINLPQFHAFAFPDEFIKQGNPAQIYAQYGLDAASVYDKIINDIGKSVSSLLPA